MREVDYSIRSNSALDVLVYLLNIAFGSGFLWVVWNGALVESLGIGAITLQEAFGLTVFIGYIRRFVK